jgi:hypothetical protein
LDERREVGRNRFDAVRAQDLTPDRTTGGMLEGDRDNPQGGDGAWS